MKDSRSIAGETGGRRSLCLGRTALMGVFLCAALAGDACAEVISECGDVDCDGVVTATDALLTLRTAVRLESLMCVTTCPDETTTTTTIASPCGAIPGGSCSLGVCPQGKDCVPLGEHACTCAPFACGDLEPLCEGDCPAGKLCLRTGVLFSCGCVGF